MVHDGCNVIFHFGLLFAPLPLQQPEKLKFKKKMKKHLDVITLHKRTKILDHML